jgi:hypothetical protein
MSWFLPSIARTAGRRSGRPSCRPAPRPWSSRGLGQHTLVALLEQGGVVVGGGAVDLDVLDLGLALDLRALGEGLALQLADLDVVEGDVERRTAAGGEPVVVDRDDAVLGRLLLDLGARRGVEVDDHQHLDLVGLHLPGDGLHLRRGAAGVLDVAVEVVLLAVGLEGVRVGGHQRGLDVVSGRMMPTFAPFPSMVPLPPEDAGAARGRAGAAGGGVLVAELEPQAARAIAATTPSTASDALVLRMR